MFGLNYLLRILINNIKHLNTLIYINNLYVRCICTVWCILFYIQSVYLFPIYNLYIYIKYTKIIKVTNWCIKSARQTHICYIHWFWYFTFHWIPHVFSSYHGDARSSKSSPRFLLVLFSFISNKSEWKRERYIRTEFHKIFIITSNFGVSYPQIIFS